MIQNLRSLLRGLNSDQFYLHRDSLHFLEPVSQQNRLGFWLPVVLWRAVGQKLTKIVSMYL